MNKMDDARKASADRDALRKPRPEDLLKENSDAARLGAYRALRKRGIDTHCPDCRTSVSFLRWDGRRKLWVHEGCGGTWTQDELEYINGSGDEDA